MSQSQKWFVHFQEETLGPLSTSAVQKMLQQNRLQFVDFAWTDGFTKWIRVSEIDEFAGMMPSYPKTSIPSKSKTLQQEEMLSSDSEVASAGTEDIVDTAESAAEKKQDGVHHKKKMHDEKQVEFSEEPHGKHQAKHHGKSHDKSHDKPHSKSHIESHQTSHGSHQTNEPKNVKNTESVSKKRAKVESQNWPKIRRFIRVPILAEADVSGHGLFSIINISEGGIYLDTSQKPLPVGAEVKFKLKAANFNKVFEMTGIVIRFSTESEKPGFVIEFTRVNPAHKRAITEYIDSQLQE